MGEIIYHNIVYQYLHTRTQHKSDMVPEKIQFSNRTMKIMFLFSLGKFYYLKLLLCLGCWGSFKGNVEWISFGFVWNSHKHHKICMKLPVTQCVKTSSSFPRLFSKLWDKNRRKYIAVLHRFSTTSLGIIYLGLEESFVVSEHEE